MTEISAEPSRTDLSAPRREQPAATATQPLRILAAIDGSEQTGRVTKCLLDLNARRAAIEIVLMSIQPAPQDGRLRGYGSFRREEIRDRLINDLGRRVVLSAARHLDAAGLGHKDRIEIGDTTETIVRCAREEGCGLIVLAEPPPGLLGRWLIRIAGRSAGSIAGAVSYLAQIPVMIAR